MPPDPDDEIVNHSGVLVTAVHEQTAGATTPTEPAPPLAGAEPLGDWRLKRHVVPA